MKSVLLIGANSYIGARLYSDLLKNYKLTGTYNQSPLFPELRKLDIRNADEISAIIAELKPEIIIHAANNANARWCQANPEEAKILNEDATKLIVTAAKEINAKIIYISSGVVADPTNVYAQTKFNSEAIVKNSGLKYLIIRPSLTLGMSPNTTADRPHNRLLKNIKEGSPAIYDTSWKFKPTYIGQISEIIHQSIERDLWNETLPVASDRLVSRFEIISDIFRFFNISVQGIDQKDPTPAIAEDLSILKRLQLPNYSYAEIVQKIADELKQQ